MNLSEKYLENEKAWNILLKDDLDIHNVEEFKVEIYKIYEEKKASIIIDMAEFEYIDSTGLGTLIGIFKDLNEDGYKLILENIKPNILKLIKITQLDDIFELRGV